MLRLLLLIWISIRLVLCGEDLCENGAKIDSIAYINNQNMWFFTSGGHYWIVKANDFPPKKATGALPNGFKRGDAAIYKNSLDACNGVKTDKRKLSEQEIHLVENTTAKGNQIMVYDLRSQKWSEPYPWNGERFIGQAKVDWNQPIDGAFVYKMTNIVVIQKKKYNVVDWSKQCTDADNAYGKALSVNDIIDLNVQTAVDATSMADDKHFYLFKDQDFWKIEITSFKEGKFTTKKDMRQDIVTEFFKFQKKCKLPVVMEGSDEPQATEGPDNPVLTEGSGPEKTTDSPAGEGTVDGELSTGNNEISPNSELGSGRQDEGGAGMWIIILVVIIVVVLIAIALIACLVMRKGKAEDSAEAAGAGAGGADVGPGDASMRSSVGGGSGAKASASSMGTSPSTMSVRSNAGLATTSKMGATGGSKVGAKTGSNMGAVKPGGSKAGTSSLGTSPSIRSKTG